MVFQESLDNILRQSVDTVHTLLSFLVGDEFNTICDPSTPYIETDSWAEVSNRNILDMIEQSKVQKLLQYQPKGDFPQLYTHEIYRNNKGVK